MKKLNKQIIIWIAVLLLVAIIIYYLTRNKSANKPEYYYLQNKKKAEMMAGKDPITLRHYIAVTRRSNKEMFYYNRYDVIDYITNNKYYQKLKTYFNDLLTKLSIIRDKIHDMIINLSNKYKAKITSLTDLLYTLLPIIKIKGKSIQYYIICYGGDLDKINLFSTYLLKVAAGKLLNNPAMNLILNVVDKVKTILVNLINKVVSLVPSSIASLAGGTDGIISNIFNLLNVSATTQSLYFSSMYDTILLYFVSIAQSYTNSLLQNFRNFQIPSKFKEKDLNGNLKPETWEQYYQRKSVICSMPDPSDVNATEELVKKQISEDPALQAAAIPVDSSFPEPPSDLTDEASQASDEASQADDGTG